MLKQIDLKTAIDLVLFEAEEVKMIRPAEKWKDSELESLNDVMNDLDEAVFLYDVPEEGGEKITSSRQKKSPRKENKQDNATKIHVNGEENIKVKKCLAFEPDSIGRKMEVKSEMTKHERKIHKLSNEEWKQMAKMRIFGASIDEIAHKFDTSEETVREYLAEYEKKHPEMVETYYRQERV